MTEKPIAPQQLLEFIDNLLDDIKTGRITPEEALVAGQQYEYLHNTLMERAEVIAEAFSDEKKFSSAITGALEEALARVRGELPQFQNEMPGQSFSQESIVARAKAFRVAREDSSSVISLQQARVAALKNTFIDRLVNNWVAQSKAAIDKDRQQSAKREVREKLEQAPLDKMLAPEMTRFIQKTLTNTQLDNESITVQREFIDETKKLASLRAIPRALVSRSDSSHPDWFTSIAIQTGSVLRADTLTRQAEVITPSTQQEKGVLVATVFFRAFSSTTTQRVFAVAADALLGQLSPFARQETIKAVFSRALEGAMAKTGVLTGRLGREFVESGLFRLVVDGAKKEFEQGAGDGRGVKQARGALDDIIGSVLRGPITARLVGTPKEMILSYFELLAIEGKLPANRKVLFPEHAPAINALFASSTPRSSLQGPVVAFPAKLPSWQALYTALLLGFAPSLLSSSGGQRQPSVGVTHGAGQLGAVVGVFASFGRALTGAAVGASGGLAGLLFGGGLGLLFNRGRGQESLTPLLEDTPKLLAIFIVVTIVALFIFPSFLNAAFINNMAKVGSLFVASQEIQAGGPYDEVFPEYSGPFPGGLTAIASCAVDRKHLTQKPFDPGGIKTHINTCAYDFDAPSYTTQVKAAHSGCVASVRTDIENNKRIKGSYGNYVLLAGTGLDGKPFYSLYAHLAQNAGSRLSVGSCVNAGDPLGSVDSTGNSTGPHLHLEFLNESQGKITKDQCYSTFALPAGCTQ